jgi:hypothetical protein
MFYFSNQKLAFISPTRNFLGDGDPKASTLSAYITRIAQVSKKKVLKS